MSHYDEHANIIQIIDQNGNAYVRNEYDEKGYVIAQYYLNNTKSTITCDEEHRENIIYLEELNRTERYRYDENYLVTHTYFDDGTCIQYEYDPWRNQTVEQERKDFVTKRTYDVYDSRIEETLLSGQEWYYEYIKGHQLQKKRANTGEEQWFTYNDQGFMVEENEKIKPGVYRQIAYERDIYGRIITEIDSEQGSTSFVYKENGEHLFTEPVIQTDVLGKQTLYTYDTMERRTSIQTACGTDPLGNYWRQERNLEGSVIKEVSQKGAKTVYGYDCLN